MNHNWKNKIASVSATIMHGEKHPSLFYRIQSTIKSTIRLPRNWEFQKCPGWEMIWVLKLNNGKLPMQNKWHNQVSASPLQGGLTITSTYNTMFHFLNKILSCFFLIFLLEIEWNHVARNGHCDLECCIHQCYMTTMII